MKYIKLALLFLGVFFAVNVHAQTSGELKRQRDKLNEQLEQLNHEYQETLNNKKATLNQLNILKKQIGLREDKISNINTQVRNLDNQISESNNTVHSLQSQLEQLKKEYAGMVLFAYHNQSAYNKLMFIFAAKDFNQAYKRLKSLQQFGAYRERQAGYIQGTEKNLHVKINQLDKDKKEKSSLLVDQVKEKESLGQEKNSQLQVVADLSKHGNLLKQQQMEIQQRLVKANREIAAAIRRDIEEAKRKADEEARIAARNEAARAKAVNANKSADSPVVKAVIKRPTTTSEALNATPEAARLSSDFLSNKGRLPWPVANGDISHGFGAYTFEGIKMDNSGVDIKAAPGASVRSVFEGEVTKTTDMGGTYLVVIKHGEYYTSYDNLRSVSVAKGQKVSTKQNIGTVATDASTGETEVQFGLYKGVTAVNPQIWLQPK